MTVDFTCFCFNWWPFCPGTWPLCPQKIDNTKGQVALTLKWRNSRPGVDYLARCLAYVHPVVVWPWACWAPQRRRNSTSTSGFAVQSAIKPGDAGDWTQDIIHAKHGLYHRATSPQKHFFWYPKLLFCSTLGNKALFYQILSLIFVKVCSWSIKHS